MTYKHSAGLPWRRDRPVARVLCLYNTTFAVDKTSMLQAGFEPANATGERRQTYALDGADTAIGPLKTFWLKSCMHFAPFQRTLQVPSISSPFIGMWSITQIMKIIRRGFSTSSYLSPLLGSYSSPKQPLLLPLQCMFFPYVEDHNFSRYKTVQNYRKKALRRPG
jgi:hypothetical protein